MHRNMVLLPEPERPKTTTTSPGAISRVMSFNTSFCPNLLQRFWRLTIGLLVSMRLVSHVAGLQPLLELRLEVGEDARDDPVQERGDDEGLKAVEVLATYVGRPVEELLGADDPDERGVLDRKSVV